MRKLYVSFLALMAGMQLAAAQQLPNTGFEQWRTAPYGEVPVGNQSYPWGSSDTVTLLTGGTVLRPAVLKAGGAHSGNYAVCIQESRYFNAFANDTEVTGGYLFLGYFDPFTTTTNLVSAPYTSRPASVTGYYKMTAGNGLDTAILVAQFSRGGTFMGSGVRFFSPNPAWSYFEVPISFLGTDQPDEMEFFMSMGLIDMSHDDTSARIYFDDVSLTLANGLKEHLFATADMNVFPNPTTGQVRVQLAGALLAEGACITVHNVAGTEVARCAAGPDNLIRLEGRPAGVYFVQLRDRSGAVLHGMRVQLR